MQKRIIIGGAGAQGKEFKDAAILSPGPSTSQVSC